MNRSTRLTRRQLIAGDCLVVVAYLLLLAPTSLVRTEAPFWPACGVLAAVALPAALRRFWPVPIFFLVLAVSVVAMVAGVLLDPLIIAAFTIYPVALGARRVRVPTAVVGGVAAVVLSVGSVAGTPVISWRRPGLAVLGIGLLTAVWTAGRMIRERRAETARAAAELASRAVAEERLRIARELHDVVAHSMGLIAVQAGTANHVIELRPAQAQEALRVIELTSRTALAEMRQMLGVLRSDVEGAELAPAPGLDDLAALVERAGKAGAPVELDLTGTELLPEGVALSVYRIVQEALTNVVRHAAPARCRVSVAAGSGEVRVEVTDDGPGARVPPREGNTGHGLIGMRERVLMYGGSFEAGPRPEGGFRVFARFPCPS